MRRSCRQLEPLFARVSGGLSEAERLVLEQHLSECTDCQHLEGVARRLFGAAREPVQLGQAARERAIARAFAGAAAPPVRVAPTRTRALGYGLAAAVVLFAGLRLGSSDPVERSVIVARRAPIVAPTDVAARDAVAPTAVTAPEAVATALAAAWHESKQAERRTFAHAKLTLAAGSRVRFDRARAIVELAEGSVDFEVDARRAERFVVLTQNFRVEVLGTQFSVSPERVHVRSGRVRVFPPTGSTLIEQLGAGETYTHPDARAVTPAPAREKRPAPRTTSAESAASLLERARAALALGDVAQARDLLAQAAVKTPSRGERAEAATLHAECALLGRDTSAAIRGYLAVAEAFADLPAGENAAFAAAQLTARKSGAREARALLERYLARYPRGRFAEEARARLRQFEAP